MNIMIVRFIDNICNCVKVAQTRSLYYFNPRINPGKLNIGPIAKIAKSHIGETVCIIRLKNWILNTVMAKPRQLTMVKAVPLIFGGAFCATKVENKGESITTTAPQNKRKESRTIGEAKKKTKGEIRQQIPESDNAEVATFWVP